MGTELLEPLVNVPYTSGPSPTAQESRRGRDTAVEFERKERALERAPLLIKTLDAMPDMVMVLNRQSADRRGEQETPGCPEDRRQADLGTTAR